MSDTSVADPYRPHQEVLFLPVPSDLSQESFREAVKLLGDDAPRVLGGSEEQITQEFADWLWERHRGVSVYFVPKQALKTEEHWWLEGYQRTVVSQ